MAGQTDYYLQLQDCDIARHITTGLAAPTPRVRRAAALCVLGLSRSVKVPPTPF
jgi:hypothetical protein